MARKSKKVAEIEEKIDATGQESDKKAAKYVIEEGKKHQEKQKKKEEKELDNLSIKRKAPKIESYYFTLCKTIHDLVQELQFPKTYDWGVWFDGKGIVLKIRDKYKKSHIKAFKPTHEPKYDLAACYKLAWWAEDLYDAIEGNTSTNGTIWTPTNSGKQ